MIHPEPTPEQAVRVLRILGEWTRRGFMYTPMLNRYRKPEEPEDTAVFFTDPRDPDGEPCVVGGVNHFDAICQATTSMQVIMGLLDEVGPKP